MAFIRLQPRSSERVTGYSSIGPPAKILSSFGGFHWGLARLTMKVDYAAIGLLPIKKEARVAFDATTRRLTPSPEARACRDSVR